MANGNVSDQRQGTAGRVILTLIAAWWFTIRGINSKGDFAMKRSTPSIRRRDFIAAPAIAALPALVAATCNLHPGLRSAQKMGKRVVITQVVFRGRHPVMDNPHLRTPAQVNKLVERAQQLRTAANVKLMALSHFLKQPISPSE